MSDYTIELNIARTAAENAAKVIRDFQSSNSFSIDLKGKNDLVTDADLEAEKQILSVIKKEFPDDDIMAEESSGDLELPEGRIWLIDPIDGTTNFAHGFPVYCVSIALWENKEPKVGLVVEVASDEWYTAIKNKGAFLNGRPISVSSIENAHGSLIGTGFPYNDLTLIDNYLSFFRMLMHQTHGVRRAGAAAYDLCCVASGRLDGFYEYSLNPWDVGAGALIITEAGGQISDWQGGDNWLFGKRIIAGNSDIHSFLLDEIQSQFTEQELIGNVVESKR